MHDLWQDLRFGLKTLSGNRAFAVVAVLTLSLGIAVTTTVFSWMNTFLLRPLPGVADGKRLVLFESVEPAGEGRNISYADYRDYHDQLQSILVALTHPVALSYGDAGRPERLSAELVSGNYFQVVGVAPILGQLFVSDEHGDKPGADPVVVLSEQFWRTRLNVDPDIVGKTIRVNRLELTVIGVTARQFAGASRGRATALWVPLSMAQPLNVIEPWVFVERKTRMLRGLARLKPGVRLEQARAEVVSVARRLAGAYPVTNEGFSATLMPEVERNALRRPLQILMAMCVVVLLITCVNVANLLLARSTARQREMSIRLALGASRTRIVRQMLTESFVLAGLGAMISLPLAIYAVRLFRYFAPPVLGAPIGIELGIRIQDLGFAMLICAAAAVAAGLAPALHATGPNLNESLGTGGRSGMSSARANRMRKLFVVAEVALAFVALAGAGLFIQSLRAARSIPIGLDTQNVLVSRFYTSASGYDARQREQFCLTLRGRLEAAPGIVAASYADTIPLGFGLGPGGLLEIESYVPSRGENMTISRSIVAPGYFRLLRIPLLEGRDFTAQDARDAVPVLIVNVAFARRYFAGTNPIGRRIRAGGRWCAVIGLVRDSKYYYPTEAPRPYFYASSGQADLPADVAFYLRTTGDPKDTIATLRREAAAVDPAAAAFDSMPLADYVDAPLFPQRIAAGLLSVLGALSLILAALGLYSVMTYAVSQRIPELGIRMALGARPIDVLGMVIRQGMRLAAGGLVVGLVAALAAARLVQGALINVSPADPYVFAGAALFLGIVALLACYVPARRATRVDPITALHYQ